MFRCQGLSTVTAAVAMAALWVLPVRGQQKQAELPAAIAPDSVVRVKQATVLLKVTSEGAVRRKGAASSR